MHELREGQSQQKERNTIHDKTNDRADTGDLKNGKRPLLADRPEESDESRFDCPLCKDQGGYLKTSWEWMCGLSAAAPPNESRAHPQRK